MTNDTHRATADANPETQEPRAEVEARKRPDRWRAAARPAHHKAPLPGPAPPGPAPPGPHLPTDPEADFLAGVCGSLERVLVFLVRTRRLMPQRLVAHTRSPVSWRHHRTRIRQPQTRGVSPTQQPLSSGPRFQVKPLRGRTPPRPLCPGSRFFPPPRAASTGGFAARRGPALLPWGSADPSPLRSPPPILASFWGPSLLPLRPPLPGPRLGEAP